MPRRTVYTPAVHRLIPGPTTTTPELPQGPGSCPAGLPGVWGRQGWGRRAGERQGPGLSLGLEQLACGGCGAGLDRLGRAPAPKLTPPSLPGVRPAPVIRHLPREAAPGPRRCQSPALVPLSTPPLAPKFASRLLRVGAPGA